MLTMGGQDKSRARRRSRKAWADCREGRHRFSSPRAIGGGMTRQTCFVCGWVSIDISRAEPPVAFSGSKDGSRAT